MVRAAPQARSTLHYRADGDGTRTGTHQTSRREGGGVGVGVGGLVEHVRVRLVCNTITSKSCDVARVWTRDVTLDVFDVTLFCVYSRFIG